MRELAGKTAFVTGGASGIGFALGRAFAEAGMKVMLADIETHALKIAVDSLRDIGPGVHANMRRCRSYWRRAGGKGGLRCVRKSACSL